MPGLEEANRPGTLVHWIRERSRLKRYSIRTEQAYCDRIRRFVLFHGKRHPAGLGALEVQAFLTSLAVEGRVAASTQNQAKSALLFLYREVLGADLPWLESVQQAKAPSRLPVVLTREEAARILARLNGVYALIGLLLYGTGLRVVQAMRLRVKDIDFSRREILVRDGKGAKDRVTMLPLKAVPPLRMQIERAREIHRGDPAVGSLGRGGVAGTHLSRAVLARGGRRPARARRRGGFGGADNGVPKRERHVFARRRAPAAGQRRIVATAGRIMYMFCPWRTMNFLR